MLLCILILVIISSFWVLSFFLSFFLYYLPDEVPGHQVMNFFLVFILFLLQAQGAKGPIFEDGPNFEMAFRLFHGHDGVVPLSGRSFLHSDNLKTKPAAPQFNPLAARTATISLSAFGPGGPFSFDSFSEKWKKQKKKSKPSRKEPSSEAGHSLIIAKLTLPIYPAKEILCSTLFFI
uniref:Uncharacterized protein n=1 Tax=Nelumbo nucifera TaxID=4432 RepID=A0A822Y488_NELNU|nr:TPA_asm: hypothetical protein HUJ06_027587 [Nelumbo nucifera]